MAITGQQIVDEVRTTVVDDTPTYRWSDALLLGWLNAGLQALFSKRPDCMLLEDDTAVQVNRPIAMNALSEVLPVDDKYSVALVQYVLHRVFLTDTDELEAASQGRAAAHKALFDEQAKVA